MKYFRFTFEGVLWDISYVNLNMLLATIPVYNFDKDDDGKKTSGPGKVSDENNIVNFLS